jgi:hypothetical protein
MNLRRAFTEHPASVGETYFQHVRSAWGFAATLLIASLACLIHGALPFLFARTASARILQLHQRMVAHRVTPTARDSQSLGSSR